MALLDFLRPTTGVLNQPQSFGQQFGGFLQNNPAMLIQLGSAIGSNAGFPNALAAIGQTVPQAMALDRQSSEQRKRQAALTRYLKAKTTGQALDPDTMMLLEEHPGLAEKYVGETIFPEKPEYGFMEVNGDIWRTDKSGGGATNIYDAPVEQYKPLTDPTERLKYGIPQTDTNPYQLGPDNKVYAISGGGTNVNVNNMGGIPPGYRVNYDENKNPVSMEPIPGGPAAQEAIDADAAAATDQSLQANKATTMLDAVGGIREEFEKANGAVVTGTASIPFGLLSNTPAGRVRSYVRALQSGVALKTILDLKNASSTGATGFGALNLRELQLLLDEVGSLDPNTTEPDIFLDTVDRIEKRWQSVIEDIRKNVSPERIKELGLEELVGGTTQPGVTTLPNGVRMWEMR